MRLGCCPFCAEPVDLTERTVTVPGDPRVIHTIMCNNTECGAVASFRAVSAYGNPQLGKSRTAELWNQRMGVES